MRAGKGRAVVVGAGLGGLAAAIGLARGGMEVTLLEAAPEVGGKAGSLRLGAYRFDTGPSLVTLPEVFRGLFASWGRRLEDYLTLVPLDPICAYWWPDGSSLRAPPGASAFARAAESALGEPAAATEAYFRRAARIHGIAGRLFLERPIHELGTWLEPGVLPRLLALPAIDPFRSLHDAGAASFRDPRLVQLFDRYATYNGSDAFRLPATFAIIPHVEYARGGFTVREGIRAIPEALGRICREEGVDLRLGERVRRIKVAGGRAAGVESERGDHPAELVVSGADVGATYAELLGLPGHPAARRYAGLEPSSSALVFYWGLSRRDPALSTNNIFFSSDYRAEFRAIFREGRVPEEPTVYVNITGRESPGDAPEGGDNCFVLVNAPPDRGQDWAAEAARLRPLVLGALRRALGWDPEPHIEVEEVLDPAAIASRTGSPGGSLYGISSNGLSAAFRRHRNRSRDIPGLYFCGGSAHPGGGMPLVLLSGSMAAELALAGRRP